MNEPAEKYKQHAYPENYKLIGSERADEGLKIFIDEAAMFKIDSYLASDINKELGGIFIGDVCVTENNKKFILIEGFVHAMHTSASVSRLTFTHQTWEYINNKIDSEHPGKTILGWYHSHPGHTVFMSSYDTFIQENFFNMDFMTAYIYDPTINDRAFFIWKNERIIKASGYYLLTDDEKPQSEKKTLILPEPQKYIVPEPPGNVSKGSEWGIKTLLLVAFTILNLFVSVFLVIKYIQVTDDLKTASDANRELSELKENYNLLNQRLENYIIESEISKQDTVKNLAPQSYVVKQGDTMKSIALQFFGDEAKADTIMKFNNIKSQSELTAGKIIIIPLIK